MAMNAGHRGSRILWPLRDDGTDLFKPALLRSAMGISVYLPDLYLVESVKQNQKYPCEEWWLLVSFGPSLIRVLR
jgi:hypothetical protein